MDEFALTRAIHVACVVLWIGGVALVTTVFLPVLRRFDDPGEAFGLFHKTEKAFIWQARITTLITGLTGFYMLYLLDGWDRYQSSEYWWVHMMTLIWAIFTLMMFVLEPFVLPKLIGAKLNANPAMALKRVHAVHWTLTALSLLTILGAVHGAHS